MKKFLMAAASVVLAGATLTAVSSAQAADTPSCYGHKATVVGTGGNDFVVAPPGPQVVVTGDGDDTIVGQPRGEVLVCAGSGADTVNGLVRVIDGGGGKDKATLDDCLPYPAYDTSPFRPAGEGQELYFSAVESLKLTPCPHGPGEVWGWGHNPSGEVGAGRTSYNVDPAVRAQGLPPVTAVAGGYAHSLALTAAGEVWSPGWNANGQLGDGTTISRSSFAPVPELSGVVQVAAGGYLSLALKGDGTVWGWGTTLYGRGPGGPSRPGQVPGLADVVAVAAGDGFSLALKRDGTVWTWGDVIGDETDRATPVKVKGLSGVSALAAGVRNALALRSDGTVWRLGGGGDGQPVQVKGISRVTGIAVAYSHSVAVTADGSVWAWGSNASGQLGNGTTTESLKPVRAGSIHNAVAVAAGSGSSFALSRDGTVWAWGTNLQGQLGHSDIRMTGGSLVPRSVNVVPRARALASGTFHVLAVTDE